MRGKICRQVLTPDDWQLEIIDVVSQAEEAEQELICAVLALVCSNLDKRVVGGIRLLGKASSPRSP